VGQGAGADYINVTVGANAQIIVPNDNSISLGNNASIVINSGALVRSTGNIGNGQYADGPNTIDVNNNSTILIKAGASVITTNTQGTSEAINPYGAGNTITNYGLIQGGASTAIWFQNANTTASSPRNVVDNYGIIQVVRPGATAYDPTAQAIGASQWVGMDFINETGGRVNGNLIFGSGNDTMTLNPGSVVTGTLDGGGGNNLITLNASATSSDTIPGNVNNFQTMNKTGAGTWILTGSVGNNGGSAPLAITVVGGTLWLTGDNTNFNGTVLIDPAGTLEARAQSLPNPTGGEGVITDNGVLLVNQVAPNAIQSNDGTYAGSIVGTGVLTKIGIGTLTLTGVNTFSGGANLNQGAIAVAADSALGAPTGPLTFNGGALRLLSSFDLSGARPIVLNGPNNGLPGGGTIDANGFQTTISQAITGAGGLTVADSTASTGAVILTGANTYGGGTTISAGTLQLGNGGTSGAIVGNVADNGTLAFDRSDVSTFAGLVSGTGALTQIGSGATILTADNTYSGGTTISAGTLQLGNGGTSGSIVGNVADNGTLAFDRSDVVTFPGTISGTGGVSQIGTGTTILNAVNPYSGPTDVAAGVLAVGDATHPTASLSGGGPVTVGAGATLGGYGGVAGDVTNSGTVAVANAVPAFHGDSNGTFTIGGNFENAGVADIGGAGVGNVLAVKGDYGTGGGAGVVKINTLLNEGGPLSNQSTDRLLVFGNASGGTSVVVNAFGAGAFTGAETPSANHGISIIQVAGASSVGAFTLASGYVTGNTPYQYQLYAYGPGSPNGRASVTQSLVGAVGPHWDYRLENVYISPEGPVTPTDPTPPPNSRPEVAPQVPAYISLPTALFNSGFQDLDSLHRRLGEIRDDQTHGVSQDGEVFIRGYGSIFNYSSDRSFQGFGYNSTQDYAATQLGGNYIARRDASGTLRVGFAATLGQLWFQPQALDGVSSGLFNTYSFAGTLTWQSAAGWYVDAVLSGGFFNGAISTNARGVSQNMSGSSFSASLEAGYPIPLGWQELTLEPQAQFVYQNLNFASQTDIDGVTARLGSPDQGVFRGGARLIRPFVSSQGDLVTPYLKANVIQGIGGGDAVNIGSTPFLTGRFGTSVQLGGGATGMISHNLSVYGDVAWQDGVGGGGTRGWVLNGGMRYAF
jgi:outer membrane autotransporter protein